jgi:hypothetical protein
MRVQARWNTVERIRNYTVSVLDTLNGETMLFHTDSISGAERKAKRMVSLLTSANAVVTISTTGEVVSYVEQVDEESVLHTVEEGSP